MIDKTALRGQKLLADLTEAEIEKVASLIVAEPYAKGKNIITEGEPTKGIYLIQRGRVEISKRTPDGWRQTLAVLAETAFFGELSVIEDRETHGADAVAIDEAEILLLRKDDLLALEGTEAALMYKIMRAIARMASRNVRTMNEKLMKALISY